MVEVDANVAKAKAGLDNIESSLRKMSGTGSNVGQIFAGVFGANMVAGAISSVRGLTAEGLNAYASYERLGQSLTSLTAREIMNTGATKSMSEAYKLAEPRAQGLLKWTQQLAILSPFTQDEVAQAFRMAEAYGFNGEEAQRMTSALIDYASAAGMTGDVMSQVALALGQIQAKGKLAGQEVLQLVNAGIPVDQILAKAFNKTTAEIVEMREKGLIPADQAINAIVSSLETDFGGAAERASGSFAGLKSSLEDLKSVGLREFFAGTAEAIKPIMAELVDSFSKGDLQSTIRSAGDAFGGFIADAIDGARELIGWWGDLDESTRTLILTFGTLILLRGPIFGLFADITAGARGLLGIIPAVTGGIKAIQTGIAAWQAGMTLTTALGAAGLSPFIIALGAGAVAAVPFTAAIYGMNKGHEALNKSIQKSRDEWDTFWQHMSTGDPQAIASRYIAAQKAIQGEIRETNRFFDLFTQNTVKETGDFERVSSSILSASSTYDEYRAALEKVAESQGLVIDANGQLIQQFDSGMGNAGERVITTFYALTEAQYENYAAGMQLSQSLSNFVDGPMRSATRQQAEYNKKLTEGHDAQQQQKDDLEDLKKAYADLVEASANTALQAGLSGVLSGAMDQYKQTMADLAPEHDALLARLNYLDVEGWIPSAESVDELTKKLLDQNDTLTKETAPHQAVIQLLASHKYQLDETKRALDENVAAQEAAAEAMREATAQMIYQQASAGLDAGAALTLARNMGMISEEDYAVSATMQSLRLAYDANADGAITAAEGASQYVGQADLMYEAVQRLHEANMPVTIDNIKKSLEDLSTVDVSVDDLLPDNEAWTTAKVSYDTFKTDATAAMTDISTAAGQSAEDTKSAFTTVNWTDLGKTTVAGGIMTGIKASTFKSDMTAFVTDIKKIWTSETWSGVGKAIITGIASGVSANSGILEDAIRAAVAAALAAAQSASQSHSPSKLFAEKVGRPISEGIAVGVLQAAPLSQKAVSNVINNTAGATYNQPINVTANVGREIDYYQLANVIAGMLANG